MAAQPHDDRLLFLRKFLRHGTQIASVAPSSPQLAAELCRYVAKDRPQVIVELGAGTGAVTEAAVRKMHPQSRLLALELDQEFAALLGQRCPRAEVLQCDVVDAQRVLAERGVRRVDVVISGLPTPSMPVGVVRTVLDFLRMVAPADAPYSQLTVMPWVYQGYYRRLFDDVSFTPVWQNLPPGGVYHCRGPRAGGRIAA